MSFTPRMMVLAARAGLLLSAIGAGAVLLLHDAEIPSVALAVAAFGVSLLALLAFPRVRRNELLIAVGACGAILGYVIMPGWTSRSAIAVGSGVAGPLAISLTLTIVRIRNLAASNAHMSFVEWRQFDRRRRRTPAGDGTALEQYAHHSRTV